ncbi:hypothetical protein SLH49_05185 [Cognatiyoonia sp. IB215446]|uniref:hypothetical protein n=1 Tax=Cognatiyoonia sp. IB215446 TaxID=3097355 RepID=UPI002A12267F|nr:hypothetical protein [Cognatiyoonia sp. IB215446]MDX8347375.1 hypothetical protein [Cognatiyoonia sp. IB215446]
MRFFGQKIDIWVSRSEKINKLMTTLRHFVWLLGLIFGLPAAALLYFSVYASENEPSQEAILPQQINDQDVQLEDISTDSIEDVPQQTSTVERKINEVSSGVADTDSEVLVDGVVGNQTPNSRSLVDGQNAIFCDGDLRLTLHMPDNTPQNRIPERPNSAMFFVLGTNPVQHRMLQVGSPTTIGNCTVVVTEIVRQRNSVRDFDVVIVEVLE